MLEPEEGRPMKTERQGKGPLGAGLFLIAVSVVGMTVAGISAWGSAQDKEWFVVGLFLVVAVIFLLVGVLGLMKLGRPDGGPAGTATNERL
ncbi:hypothetical protein KV100_19135 [Mumia sp. zg.B21]|uniref:hypothetical protein n=1 Tax=Mumia sp. zg.B21 TaxID=2855447 RepID=UPI001C6EC200|nr:hypothetical protein [Mumia sp. zg.B21]MBW9211769.1 hypothetical protein [Mumia sp. zg.B21]